MVTLPRKDFLTFFNLVALLTLDVPRLPLQIMVKGFGLLNFAFGSHTTIMSPVPLKDLASRIAKQEAELARLREEQQARQELLAQLEQRKEELQAQLKEVQLEIQTVSGSKGSIPLSKTPQAKSAPKVAAKKKTAPAGANGKSIPERIQEYVAEQGRNVTIAEITDVLMRSGLRTSAKEPKRMLRNKVMELVKRGHLERVPGESSVRLPQSASKAAPTPTPAPTPTSARSQTTPTAREKPAQPLGLRDMIISILKRSRKPLSLMDIIDRVLANGYTTQSPNIKQVIASQLGRMKGEVEIDPLTKGYRVRGK